MLHPQAVAEAGVVEAAEVEDVAEGTITKVRMTTTIKEKATVIITLKLAHQHHRANQMVDEDEVGVIIPQRGVRLDAVVMVGGGGRHRLLITLRRMPQSNQWQTKLLLNRITKLKRG